jgi:hypothetical protein
LRLRVKVDLGPMAKETAAYNLGLIATKAHDGLKQYEDIHAMTLDAHSHRIGDIGAENEVDTETSLRSTCTSWTLCLSTCIAPV